VLADRVQALASQLALGERQLPAVTTGQPAVLRQQVESRLRDHQDVLSRLDDLTDSAEVWARLTELESSAATTFAELLGLVNAASQRASGVDGGLGRLADAVVAELAARSGIDWDGVTVLDVADAVSEESGIIRLRFPHLGPWNLPSCAHELGHYVGTRIRERLKGDEFPFTWATPLQTLLEQQDPETNHWHHANELFADVYATYALGPAFAFTAIRLRFDPRRTRPTSRHPSDHDRVWAVCTTLEHLGDRPAGRMVAGQAIQVGEEWAAAVAAAGVGTASAVVADSAADRATATPEVPSALAAQVVPSFLDLLDRRVGAGRYETFSRAMQLSEAAPDDRPAASSLADGLNAAWLRRRRAEAEGRLDLDAQSRWAMDLFHDLAGPA
jgi:hypothetical protein